MAQKYDRESLTGDDLTRRLRRDINEISELGDIARPPTIETKNARLGKGDYGVARITEGGTTIVGIGHATKLTDVVVAADPVIISACYIDNIRLDSGAVILQNCYLSRDQAPYFELVSGVAILVGCIFLERAPSGSVYENAGANADIQSVGCYNASGLSYGSHTSVGSL